MNGLKQKEEEIGLVDLNDKGNDEPETGDAASLEKAGRSRKNAGMALAGILAGSLVMLLLGILLFQQPLVTVGVVIVIEAVVAAALNDSKLLVHIGVMVLQALLGVWFGHTLFLILAAAYYFVLVVALKLLELDG